MNVRPTGRGCPEGPQAGGFAGADGEPGVGLLRRMSAHSDPAAWETRQIVDASRSCFVDLAQVSAGKGVDRDDLREEQRSLQACWANGPRCCFQYDLVTDF
jgi:hypothetical protein